MTKRRISRVNDGLLPVICTCQGHDCKEQFEVTEISDFRIEKLSGADRDTPVPEEEIVVTCDTCQNYCFPPEAKKKALIAAFKMWKKLGHSSVQTGPWSTEFTCLECQRTSTITRKNLSAGITSDSANYGGERATYEAKIKCPVCDSLSKAHGFVPSGIESKVMERFYAATRD